MVVGLALDVYDGCILIDCRHQNRVPPCLLSVRDAWKFHSYLIVLGFFANGRGFLPFEDFFCFVASIPSSSIRQLSTLRRAPIHSSESLQKKTCEPDVPSSSSPPHFPQRSSVTSFQFSNRTLVGLSLLLSPPKNRALLAGLLVN